MTPLARFVPRLTTVLALTVGLALPAAHADDDDVAEMRAIATAAKLISLEEASEKALAAKPGGIVEAELERRLLGDGFDYEFEIVDAQGKSWDVHIDAKTGQTTRLRRDWFDD